MPFDLETWYRIRREQGVRAGELYWKSFPFDEVWAVYSVKLAADMRKCREARTDSQIVAPTPQE